MGLKHAVARRARRAAQALARSFVARLPARAAVAEYVYRSGLFDTYAYAQTAGRSGLGPRALIRRYLSEPALGCPQPRFDPARYRALAGLSPGDNPFVHFVLHGRDDGLADGFAASAYLRENPDVRIAGWDATRHFVERGWCEGRLAAPAPLAPGVPDFTGLAGRTGGKAAQGVVDVIIPAYRGHAETLGAIHSVLSAKVAQDFRLLVIDDASPEPELSADLIALEARGLIARMVNPVNLGFTITANRGLAESRDGDVVLLNADTEVYDGWLDRLRAHAHGSARVGTVTPLSNAATILSYPIRLRDNGASLELSHRSLAELAGRRAPISVEIPTGVGFCLFLRRACLDAVGPFDEVAFPRGYGEENDFCRRASARGWRHLAATDTFVTHLGSRSFGGDRAALVAEGLRTMEVRHPGYEALIADFIEADPLAAARAELDIARILHAGHSGRLVHGARPEELGDGDLILRRYAGARAVSYIRAPRVGNTPNLPAFNPVGAPDEAGRLLRDLGVRELVIFESAMLGRQQEVALKRLAAMSNLVVRDG